MEDKFDKILSNKIKNLSENREIPYNPEHWDMLLAKKNKRRRGLISYWKYAAILICALLVGGIGNYFYKNSFSKKSIKPQIILDEINDSIRRDSLGINPVIEITTIDNDSVLNGILKNTKLEKYRGVEKSPREKESSIANTETISKTKNNKNNNNRLAQGTTNSLAEYTIDSLSKTEVVDAKTVIDISTELVTKSFNQTNDSIFEKNEITLNDKEYKRDSLTGKEDIMALVEDNVYEQKSNSRAIKLGLNVSPVIDYNQENVSSNIGFAGGVIVEFPVLKKFNINTGIYYSNQKIDLNSNQPSAYLSDGIGAKESIKIVDEEAIIEGIGIPVNIKYNFAIKNNNFFVSTGFSSSSYFKENIESQQIVNSRTKSVSKDFSGKNIVKYELIQVSETTVISEDSNTFNFANALNFSMGVELPVNNQKQSIIIEPYFKYYLQTATAKNIDYNSIGFHFRYNFNFRRK